VRLLKVCKGKIKSVTVKRVASGKLYASILTEDKDKKPDVKIDIKKTVGIDMSMKDFAVTSDGERANYPRYYRKSEKKLSTLQRKLARKVKGSNNRHKAKMKLARLHEKVTNQREDFLHRASKQLIERYDVIGLEDINLQAMSKGLRLGKPVYDNGFGKFREMLAYKAERCGKILVKIDKWFASTRLCSNCGYQNKEIKNLGVRSWGCPACGTLHDRDINAAMNIGKKAIEQTTLATRGSDASGEGQSNTTY
jgi:putative transposase